MKKITKIISVLLFLAFGFILCISSYATDYKYNFSTPESFNIEDIELYPGGMPFGVKMTTKGLCIVKFASNNAPAVKAGLKIGDLIVKVNGKEINSIEDFSKLVNKLGSEAINISVTRDGKELNFKVIPEYSRDDGSYKTGIWVKDSTAGIGTVTFINPQNNSFGGLGHGICSPCSGEIIPFKKGIILDVSINGVTKGRIGSAGELKGNFNAKKLGTLVTNSSQGVFGVLSNDCFSSPENKMKICPKNEVKEGKAYIWCTLDNGKPEKYSVCLYDINPTSTGPKSFKVKVTDKRLLEKTGGIVQGMSGSPIIQNGKFVGAVTHVLINDPSAGYGIFIENMLSSMPSMLK